MKILALHRQQSAVGYYRTWLPARTLRALGHDVTWWEDRPYFKAMTRNPPRWHRENGPFDLILCDRAIKIDEAGMLAGFRHHSPNGRLIVDFDDDFMHVPPWNASSRDYQPGQELYEVGRSFLKLCEGATVSTTTLAQTYKMHTHHIWHAPNVIDPADWVGFSQNPDAAADPAVRILYGGASGHFGDLDAIRPGLERFLRKPPCKIRLICLGSVPGWLYDLEREFLAERRLLCLPWVPFGDYPRAVAWGRFDFAIAPLAQHRFNDAKSDIKWLEAGIQGIPLVCSNVGPFAALPDECALKLDNVEQEWEEGLRAMATDPSLRQRKRIAAHAAVRDTRLVDTLRPIWQSIVEEAANLPRITTLADTRLPHEASV